MTSPQRMDKSLTAIKDAIKAAQQAFDADIQTYPQDALQTAGAVLNELSGEVNRLITEFTRDAERPIGLDPNATRKNTGLKSAANIRKIREAHSHTTHAQYQQVKQQQEAKGEICKRMDVLMAGSNPSTSTTPNPNSSRQLRAENAQLRQQVGSLTNRVKKLEDTLEYYQIALPE